MLVGSKSNCRKSGPRRSWVSLMLSLVNKLKLVFCFAVKRLHMQSALSRLRSHHCQCPIYLLPKHWWTRRRRQHGAAKVDWQLTMPIHSRRCCISPTTASIALSAGLETDPTSPIFRFAFHCWSDNVHLCSASCTIWMETVQNMYKASNGISLYKTVSRKKMWNDESVFWT